MNFKDNDSMSNSNSFYGAGNPVGEKDLGGLKVAAELMNNQADWKGVPEAVKWTLKALFDVTQSIVITQGIRRKEIDQLVNSKASKAELSSYLTTKANITDVSAAISQVATQLESKIDEETFNSCIGDKVTYDDLQFVCDKKLDVEVFEDLIKKIVRTLLILF